MTADLRERLGLVGVWGHLDSLPAPEALDFVRLVEDLGYGALWVPETVGREPFSLLAMATAVTDRLMLGTSIASIYARDAVTMRTSAMTLHEAGGGRFVLGLGVSHPHLVTRLRGIPFDRPLSRMREYLAAYRAAPWRGPELPRDEAAGPPVLLAALRERMLGLAATDADGAFPYLVTPDRVHWMRGVLDGAAAGSNGAGPSRPLIAVTLPVVLQEDAPTARSTARAYLAPYLRTPTYHASWSAQGFDEVDWAQPGSDRLVDAMVARGSVGELEERIAEMHQAGADHVALIALAPDGTTEHRGTLQSLAARR